MSKTLAMYDYRKLPEKKNLTVAKIHRLWVRDFKDEKKWPIKTAKMSTLPGVYRLEYDKTTINSQNLQIGNSDPMVILRNRRLQGNYGIP